MLFVFIADGQLHQTAGVRIQRGFTQLHRVHLAQPFKALNVRFALLAFELLQHARFLFFRQRIVDFFAKVDTVQRRQRHVDVTVFHQRAEVLHEQRTEQRGDVQTIGVRIREDTDLAVAQLAQIVAVRIDADRHGDVVYFLRGQHFIRRDLPGVEDLTLERHDRLIFTIARLLGRSACRVPFHQEQLGAVEILGGTVRQLARQRGAAGQLFTHHFLRRAQATLGAGDGHFSQHFCGLNVLVQPQGKRIFHHAGDERRTLA